MKQDWLAAGYLLRLWMDRDPAIVLPDEPVFRARTCRELGNLCGVSAATVSRWCMGQATPSEDARQFLDFMLPPDIFEALAADWWGYKIEPWERKLWEEVSRKIGRKP